MVYISRKIVYPIFILLFAIVFFSVIFLFSFNQVLKVDDAELEFFGDKIIFTAKVSNISNHLVRNSELLIRMGDQERIAKIKDLAVGESFEVISELPFSESLQYEVFVTTPFSKPIKMFFELDESTVKPVVAEVQIGSDSPISSIMTIGKKYDVTVSLCNVSKNDLFEVIWFETVNENFFEEKFFPRSISLRINECKNLYSTLTPINSGEANLTFVLRVGSLEQKESKIITVGE